MFYTVREWRRCTGHRCTSAWRSLAKRIEVQIGDALAIVKKTPGMFDVIFIDVDKNLIPCRAACGAATASAGWFAYCGQYDLVRQGGASSTGGGQGHEGRAGIQPNGVCVERASPPGADSTARRPDYLPQELGKPVATAGTGTPKQIVRRNMPYRSGRTLGYRMRSRLPLLAQSRRANTSPSVSALEGKAHMICSARAFQLLALSGHLHVPQLMSLSGCKADMTFCTAHVRF